MTAVTLAGPGKSRENKDKTASDTEDFQGELIRYRWIG